MVVRELLTRLGFQVNDAQLKKYEAGVSNIKSQADNAAASFRNMFGAFLGFQGLKKLASTADSMQSIEARIGMLPQTVGDVGDAFGLVAQKASESRTSIEAYGQLYVRLAGATKNFLTTQGEVLEVATAISDALIVGGANSEEAASATLQLSQAFQKGKLDGDEFRSFMENMATDVKERLAKELGAKDVGDLFKMSESGKLVAKDLAFAFRKIAPEIRERMLKMPMTISQGLTIAGNEWKTFIADLNRDSKVVTSISNSIIDGFSIVKNTLRILTKMLGGASNTIRVFGITALVALSPFIAGLVAAGIAALPMVALVVALGLAVDDLLTYMRGGDSVIGRFFNEFRTGVDTKGKPALVILAALISYVAATLAMAAIGAVVNYAKMTVAALLHYKSTRIAAILSYAEQGAAFVNMVAKTLWGYGVMAAKAIWAGLRMHAAWLLALGPIGLIIAAIETIVALLAGDKIRKFLGFGVTVNVTAGKVAGAASSPSGVAGAGSNSPNYNVTVNQELPAGTTKETADAAKNASLQVFKGTGNDILSRQMGAYAQ